MSVDFNREVDRRSTSDVKWRPEGLKGYLPIEVSENEIPMWIADMDFACPECIVRAIKERADKEIFGYCSYKQEYYDALTWWFDNKLLPTTSTTRRFHSCNVSNFPKHGLYLSVSS